MSENGSSSKIIWNFDENDDDFDLICLDVEIDESDGFEVNLQSISNHMHSFIDVDFCLEYLASRWFYRIFLIVSDRLALSILSQVKKMDYIVSIFVFCEHDISEKSEIVYSEKCRGIFTKKDTLLLNVIEHIFMKTSFISISNVFRGVDTNQKSFMDSNDILLYSVLTDVNKAACSDFQDDSISFDRQQMLRECRLYYQNNKQMIEQIDKFSQEYNPIEAIKCYTRDSFLFRIVNKAIRTHSTEIIGKFRFFIKDLEESLDLFFAKQIFDQWSSSYLLNSKLLVVYRGQRLSHDDMIRLQSLVGQDITMSQYISTTKNIQIAKIFAGDGQGRPHFESVMYEIDTSIIYENYNDKPDPSIYYYDINYISQIEEEEEVLFRIGTIFKVVSIEEPSESVGNRWHVKLRLEKGDFRSKNTINRTPMEIVQSFFNKASQKQKINVENIIHEHLSSDIVIIMSVFIRLGHLVKHHPSEQLHYYQSALSIIPSNESALLEVGYWAIRMRCISSVNDWTSVPLSIYRQTVLHIDGDLRKKLHHELARIDEARGAFYSAKTHSNEVFKYTDDPLEKQLISIDIERLDKKVDKLKPMLPPGEIAYWYLYVGVLTTTERSLIDNECRNFHQSIDNRHFSEDFSFNDLLPHINYDEHIQLLNDSSDNVKFDSIDFSIKHVLVKSLTDKPLILNLENKLTIRQLKEKIRSKFEIPYPEKYDFRLIHLGITLTDQEKSLDDYQINDQSVIYLIHGPPIQNKPVNRLAQQLQESTGLTASNIQSIIAAETLRTNRLMAKTEKQSEILMNLRRNFRQNGEITTETVNNAYEKFYQENLLLSQYDDDDDDADPDHLLGMTGSIANQYIENSGPHISIFQMMDLFSRPHHRNSIEENNNYQQTFSNDFHYDRQNEDESEGNQTEQQTDQTTLNNDEYSFPSSCNPS